MKFFLLVSLLLIYFPALYFYKSRIVQVMGDAAKLEHLRWYEGAEYVMKHSSDAHQRQTLLTLRNQIRSISMTGIILFWLIVLFYP